MLGATQIPIFLPPPQPPPEEKINGILLGFRLRYRELLYDRLRSYSAHAISSISAWADLTGEAVSAPRRPCSSNTRTQLPAPARADMSVSQALRFPTVGNFHTGLFGSKIYSPF